MKPTIIEGDRVLVNKLAYGLRVPFTERWLLHWQSPQRGEVVVCFAPDDGDRLVKRVIGLPGDRIELRANRLWVNGTAVEYGPLDPSAVEPRGLAQHPGQRYLAETLDGRRHPIMVTSAVPAKRTFGPVTVPPDQYFVLGDNRDASRDSRFFGFVPREAIVGRTSTVVLSFDPENYYLPRWGRSFHKLP
jgi:signal peptidase I